MPKRALSLGRLEQAALKSEFREAYRRPGANHLGIACVFGGTISLAYYVIDGLGSLQLWIGGAQYLRLGVTVAYLSLAIVCFKSPAFASRNYSPLLTVAFILMVAVACYISYVRHKDEPRVELLWAVDTTLLTCLVVTFSVSRLSAASTSAIVSCFSLGTILALLVVADVDLSQVRRIAIHLLIEGTCCFWLRRSIERREWGLFLLAKESSRRNLQTMELDASRRAAEAADAAKSRFLANMSHEIRTPMNGVLQILEVVGEHVGSEDRALIDKGRKAGQALLRILNGILDYAKLSHGAAGVNAAEVDVAEVCRIAMDLHIAAATTRDLELRSRLDLPPGSGSHVWVDEVKLFEIINNLLSNALKFTRAGFVEMRVRLSLPRPMNFSEAILDIWVTDSGPGIGGDDRDKIFLPFYQGEGGTDRPVGGTGLGLSIVKELVQMLHGTVGVDGAAAGGSVFHVSLPVRMATSSAAEPSSSRRLDEADAAGEFRGRRLLLVDDNDLNAMLASRVLEALGFEVVAAEDGSKAIDVFREQRFDIVLMDCQMPVMDGYTATQHLRELERRTGATRTPVIAMTAYTLAGDREKCLAAGMDDYLGKPYSVKELRPKLLRWLAQAQGQHAEPAPSVS